MKDAFVIDTIRMMKEMLLFHISNQQKKKIV